MFTAFISLFKAEPDEISPTLDIANAALQMRVAHMFYAPRIEPKVSAMELKRAALVKEELAISTAIAA